MDRKGIVIKSFKEDNKYYFILFTPNYDDYVKQFSGFGESEVSYENSLNKMVHDLVKNMSLRKKILVRRLKSGLKDMSIELDKDTGIQESEILERIASNINFYE